jgi:hypothetical protein
VDRADDSRSLIFEQKLFRLKIYGAREALSTETPSQFPRLGSNSVKTNCISGLLTKLFRKSAANNLLTACTTGCATTRESVPR